MTLDKNLKLAENAVLSVEESLSKVFQERSNQVFQKLENILTIFKEEKVSTSHFIIIFLLGNCLFRCHSWISQIVIT